MQVLLFGGLCLFTDSLAVRSRGGGLVLAGLGGLALGLTVLASIASLVVLLPALPGARGAVRGAATAGGAVRGRARCRRWRRGWLPG